MNKKEILSAVRYAGAFVAWVIGSGFATGQEVLHFFASYGYMSYAVAGINMARLLKGQQLLSFPKETMIGALLSYITSNEHKTFQPINSNWGILAEIEMDKKTRKNKRLKCEILANRSISTLKDFIESNGL